MDKFHGYLMFTPGFMKTPVPIRAPNKRNKATFKIEEGFQLFLKKSTLQKYQRTLFSTDPPGLYQVLSYWERFTRIVECFTLGNEGVRTLQQIKPGSGDDGFKTHS